MTGSRRPPADEAPPAGPADGTTARPGTDTAPGPAGSPGTGDAAQMRRTHVRGSALLVAGRVLTLLLTTTTQILIVRALTKSDFGAFSYALALASAGQTLLSLGQGRLLSRFMAKYEEEGDHGRMFGSMLLAVGTILVTSTLLITTLFLFREALVESAVRDPATVSVVFVLVFLAPLEALDQVFVSLFAVFSKARAIFFRKYLFTPGLRLAVVLALILTDASLTFLAVGYLAAGAVGLVVYVLVFVKVLRERGLLQHLRLRRVVLPYRAVFGFSLPLITGEFLLLSLTVVGVFLLGYHHSAAEVAAFRAVFNPSRLNNAVVQSFVPLFLPLAARLFARGDIPGLRRAYWQTATFVAVLSFPLFALTGPLAGDITVLLFGERYADSALVLALLSTGYYYSVVLGSNAYTLQVCGRIRYLVGVNLSVLALNVGLNLLLVPRFAAVGVAIANLVAVVTQNTLNQWALRRAIGTGFVDRRCLRAYLTIVVCAGALWAFQALADPGLAVGLVAAAVASLVVLAASRSALDLADTFPELRRVPVVRWLVRAPGGDPPSRENEVRT